MDNGNGTYSHCFADCKCVETRNSIMRMKRSGLKDIIRDYTFDKFVASEPWQQTIKEAAVNYSENPNGWFALFGQSGCGKTHLCTAISRKFLLDGKRVVYMLWRDEIVRIKDAARGGDDSDELRKLLDRYKTADVLYIDDLFKTGRAADNTMPKPTPADINYAFEIINYRYNNPALLTIISSEMSIDELLDVDEAIGGRIYERATAFTIGKSREKNYRLKKAVTL
jgi:DNA replication protein DnaC